MMKRRTLSLFPIALAACSEQPPAAAPGNDVGSMGAPQTSVEAMPPTPVPTMSAAPGATPADFAGRWIGVEGMYLVVTPGTGDAVSLEMQWNLDEKGKFDGRVVGDAIAFTRQGALLTLKRSDGDATGLKYLAGKKECLTVADGEGYCRD